MNGSAAENNSFWKILVSLRKLFKPHHKPIKNVAEWGLGLGCLASEVEHNTDGVTKVQTEVLLLRWRLPAPSPAPSPWVPFLPSLYLQMGLHWSYDALDSGTRCEIKGLLFCPFLFFCTLSAKQKRPEFTFNLEHMKNITVHMLFYDRFVHFIIQQANNENIRTQLRKDVFSLEDSITYISFLVVAVLQFQILTC